MRILDFTDGFESATEPTSVGFPATFVSVTPTGNLESDNSQDALVELQGDIDSLDARLDTAESDIDTAQADLLALDGRLDTVETTLPNKANVTDLNSHTGDTGNPHGVTAAQVGNGTAQWNANKIQGVTVSSTSPTSGQILKYDGTNWAPGNEATAPATPTVQTFTSGSGTYTTPAGCRWIKVTMVGGGGGGAGSGTSATTGTAGGNSTFGSSLLTANGGAGGNTYGRVNGGTATVNSPAVAISVVQGGGGTGASNTNTNSAGGSGGATILGGNGSGGGATQSAGNGSSNTGGGGGGGGTGASSQQSGGGGGGGGGLVAIITSPSSTYSYSVGASGAFGTAGTSGSSGGAGGSGVIIVEEYY